MSKPLAQPVSDNPIAAAVSALQSGGDLEAAVYGTPSANSDAPASDSNSDSMDALLGLQDSEDNEKKDAEENSEASNSVDSLIKEATGEGKESNGAKDAKKANPNLIKIPVSDHKGRRVVEVDLSDAEKVKKYVQYAHGGMKWKADKDRVEAEHKKLSAEHQKLSGDWQTLEESFKEGGFKGLYKTLSQDEKAYDAFIDAEIERRQRINSASPVERERYEMEERFQNERREREKLTKDIENLRNQSVSNREAAEQEALKGMVHPAFDRYRMAGKLGNPVNEERVDRAIWNQAMEDLQPLEEQGVEITPAVIDRAFRKASMDFKSIIQVTAEKEASKAIQQKKAVASERVAVKAAKGYQSNSSAENLKKQVGDGNFVGALTQLLSGMK